jgi:Protein of unknown function (DUF4238)
LVPAAATPEDLAALKRATAAAAAAEATPRKPLLDGPKRQHYLPRFYLDGFATDGMVAVYDREKGEVRRQQPKDTTVIGHFYTMEDAEGRRRFEIEALLSEYEGKAAPVIKKLAAKGGVTADERTDLAIFMALGAMRTPDIVESLQQMNSAMVLETAKRIYADTEMVAADLRKDPAYADKSDDEVRAEAQSMVDMAQNGGITVQTSEKWAVRMAVKMSIEVAPIFSGRDWVIVHRDSDKKSFITTDAPVVLTSTGPRQPSIYGIGFGSADALVMFPLAQSCVLMMLGDDGGFRHIEANTDRMRSVNLAMAEKCKRFVVGRDEALVKSLAEKVGLAGRQWQPKMQAG